MTRSRPYTYCWAGRPMRWAANEECLLITEFMVYRTGVTCCFCVCRRSVTPAPIVISPWPRPGQPVRWTANHHLTWRSREASPPVSPENPDAIVTKVTFSLHAVKHQIQIVCKSTGYKKMLFYVAFCMNFQGMRIYMAKQTPSFLFVSLCFKLNIRYGIGHFISFRNRPKIAE